jgi:hypothetical protein
MRILYNDIFKTLKYTKRKKYFLYIYANEYAHVRAYNWYIYLN